MWQDLCNKAISWRNPTWFSNLCSCRTQKNIKLYPLFHILKQSFISFISYTKFHLIHSVIHFHHNDFIDHGPSHSNLSYLLILILHCYFVFIVSFTLQLIRFLETNSVNLKLNSDGIATPCYFTLSWNQVRIWEWSSCKDFCACPNIMHVHIIYLISSCTVITMTLSDIQTCNV